MIFIRSPQAGQSSGSTKYVLAMSLAHWLRRWVANSLSSSLGALRVTSGARAGGLVPPGASGVARGVDQEIKDALAEEILKPGEVDVFHGEERSVGEKKTQGAQSVGVWVVDEQIYEATDYTGGLSPSIDPSRRTPQRN